MVLTKIQIVESIHNQTGLACCLIVLISTPGHWFLLVHPVVYMSRFHGDDLWFISPSISAGP